MGKLLGAFASLYTRKIPMGTIGKANTNCLIKVFFKETFAGESR
jgi:hypothetical protein